MLSVQERQLVEDTFARGPVALLEKGFTLAQIQEFMTRTDVAAHRALLERELDHKDALEVRTRYMARRGLASLSQGAVAILAQALAGPQYLTAQREDGTVYTQIDAHQRPILRRPEPTPTQIRAAEAILDGIGVTYARAKNESQTVGSTTEPLFKADEAQVTIIANDPEHTKPSQRALSRERVRAVIDVLAPRVSALHDQLNKNLGLIEVEPAKPKKRKKKAPPRGKARPSKGKG